MKSTLKTLVATGMLAVLAMGPLANAVKAEEQNGAQVAGKEKKAPFQGKISAVDEGAKTFSVGGKEKVRVFHITPESKIKKDGEPATLADAKVGDEVGGQAKITADSRWEVLTLRIGPKSGTGKQAKAAEGE